MVTLAHKKVNASHSEVRRHSREGGLQWRERFPRWFGAVAYGHYGAWVLPEEGPGYRDVWVDRKQPWRSRFRPGCRHTLRRYGPRAARPQPDRARQTT